MIPKEYIEFFQKLELSENNNKEWFHAHKKEYEKFVKEPFLNLLEVLIPFVQEMEPGVPVDPKAALFRINRDVRFSKDKTPYNTLMKAGFSENGKKSELPGFYLGVSATKLHVGGGLFNVKSDQLKEVRQLIKEDTERFLSIVEDDEFVSYFKGLKGEQNKWIPEEFKSTHVRTPYIANKQFYAMRELNIKDYVGREEIVDVVKETFSKINELNQYLKLAYR